MYGDYLDFSKVKRALVVIMRHHGDVLLSSPVFTQLKTKIPHVDAMIYAETLPMLEGHPAISEFLLYDKKKKKNFIHEIRFFWELRKRGYDLVVNLTEGDRGAIAARISGALYRVGPEGKKKSGYTHIVKKCHPPRHTVERKLDSVRRMGIFPQEDDRELFFSIPESAEARMRTLLGDTQDFILIHPTSRWLFKCWPTDRVAALIEALHAKGYKMVLSSGPDKAEMGKIAEILKKVSHIPLCNVAGKISLKELGALIQMSRCLLCVDSVPLHIASALKAPVVALFGPSSEVNWGPWKNPKARILAQNFSCRPCHLDGCGGSKVSDCLYTIPVHTVLQAVEECCQPRSSLKVLV